MREEKMKYERLSKRALGCMYEATVILSVILLAAIICVNAFWLSPKDIRIGEIISLVLVVLIILNCVISPYFRYRRYGYHIDEECIDTVEGYLFIERNIVPMERLHKLQVERGPVARAFGVANVVVTTAGGDVEINLLEDEKAEQIAENLQKRINQIAAEEKHGNDRNEI